MARAAGIEMPETRLFEYGEGQSWFGVRRFDREAGKRIHMHTLGGLIDDNFRLPSLDYIDWLKVTQALTRNAADVERAFSLMIGVIRPAYLPATVSFLLCRMKAGFHSVESVF